MIVSGKILYELHFPVELIIIQVIFLGIFFLAPRVYAFVVKNSSLAMEHAVKSKVCVISYTAVVVLAIGFFFFDKGLLDMYRQVRELYETGQYESVAGEVEALIPGAVTDKGHESFSVEGIPFEYEMLEYKVGYQTIKPLGGIIRNGQKLKIKYVVYNGENRIIYIEELQDG